MQGSKIFYSLPKKTQPTSSSSLKHHRSPPTTQIKISGRNESEMCPQVREFKMIKQQRKLFRHQEQQYTHKMLIDYGKIKSSFYQGKYDKGEKSDMNQEEREEMRTKRVTGIHTLIEDCEQDLQTQKKKVEKIEYQMNLTEQVRVSSGGKKGKLKEVRAYESKDGNRKRLHSRIIKMMVGGGKVQTRIICYPDNSEYLRLCGIK